MLYYYGKFAIEILPDKKNTELLHGRCPELQFSNSENSYESIFSNFKTYVNNYLASKPQMKKLTIKYKSYELEVEIHPINPTTGLLIPYIKGICDSISFVKDGHYKNEDYSYVVNFFIEKVDLLTESKKEEKFYNHLLTQLDRVAQKDKEDNFTPFELREQLISISHLFSKVLDITLEDIYKLYFARAEG